MTMAGGDGEAGAARAPASLTGFNLAAAAALLGLSVLALIWLIPAHVPVRPGIDQGLSARFMPRLAAWSVAVLAALLMAELGFRHLRGLGPIAEDNEDNDQQGFGVRVAFNVLLLSAGSAVYVALLATLGFVAGTGLTLAGCLWAGGMRNPLWLAALGLGLPLALQQGLWHGLYVILPRGMFF